MPDIGHDLLIGASREEVWRALTTTDGLAGWWTLGETVLEGDPGRLGLFTFKSRAVVTVLEVIHAEQPARLVWRAGASNAPGGWSGTRITFILTQTPKGVRLRFTHAGFAKDDDGFRKVTAGWAHYLGILKARLERPGLPAEPPGGV